jgi:hypothetical protein
MTASNRALLCEFQERDTQIGTSDEAMLHVRATVGRTEQREY